MGSITLRHPEPIPDGWTQGDCEAWEERAAILELDGRFDRETAEWLAQDEIDARKRKERQRWERETWESRARTDQERKNFEQQLKQAAETVRSWPKWKQRAVSESVRIPTQPKYRLNRGAVGRG